MSAILVLLLLITLCLLIAGLVVPQKLASRINKSNSKNLTRKHFGLGFGLMFIALFILVGVTAPPQTKTVQFNTVNRTNKDQPQAKVETKTVTQSKDVPFENSTVQDSTLAKGITKVTTQGIVGVETLKYKDTYTDGKLTSHNLVSDDVTTKPVTQVTSVGTYVAPTPTPATTTPTPAPSTTTSCTPLTNGGNCYEPGEYCRNSDHGASGVAGDGKSITCLDNNGWRWEPS